MILDGDQLHEAGARDDSEDATGVVDTGHVEQYTSSHDTIAASELASRPTKSISISGPWYDVEEGCWIDEPAPRVGSCEQQGVPSTPAQDQPQILLQSSTPLQDANNQQDIGDITQSTSVESAPHSVPKPSDNGDNGWTDDTMAELEKELELATVDQINTSSTSTLSSTPSSPRSRSIEAPQGEIQRRECNETTGSRPEEPRYASRHGTPAPGLGEWEQRETRMVETPERSEPRWEELVGEAGEVAMQQQEELRRPALGDQQDLVEVVDALDPEDKEPAEALPAAQLEIDNHRFRLRGIRARQLAGRHTKTTQYRVVWGEHPNRYDSWVNEDNIRTSMVPPPCDRSSQDLAPQEKWDVVRVHRIRYGRRSKGRKVFEYLVDELSTWINEDQLEVSLSPTMVAELRGK